MCVISKHSELDFGGGPATKFVYPLTLDTAANKAEVIE